MRKIILIMIFIMLLLPVYALDDAIGLEEELNIMDGNGLVMLVIDPIDGSILYANQAASDFYGYTIRQLEKMLISDINTLSKIEVEGEMQLAQFENRNYFEFRHQLKSGDIRNVDVYSYPFTFREDVYLLSIVVNQTNRIELEKSFNMINDDYKHLMRIFITTSIGLLIIIAILLIFIIIRNKSIKNYKQKDLLTKTYNRSYLAKEYDQLIKDKKFPMAFFMVDVNNLKFVNDTFGHKKGDQLIKEVSRRLTDVKYRDVKVSRVTGDEFVLILPDCAIASAKILDRDIRENKINIENLELRTSVGYTLVADETVSFDKAFSLAESNMYADKREHKNGAIKKIEDQLLLCAYEGNEGMRKKDMFISDLSGYIAELIDLSKSDALDIMKAGRIHRLGASLVVNQVDIPEQGYLILSSLGQSTNICEAVRYCSTNFDGSGYPSLSANEIPLFARILRLSIGISQVIYDDPNYEDALDSVMSDQGKYYDIQLLKAIDKNDLLTYLKKREI